MGSLSTRLSISMRRVSPVSTPWKSTRSSRKELSSLHWDESEALGDSVTNAEASDLPGLAGLVSALVTLTLSKPLVKGTDSLE